MLYRLLALACLGTAPFSAPAQEFVFSYPEVIADTDAGFDDPQPRISEIDGQQTTLGEERRRAFEAAANVWAGILDITVPVRVRAFFPDLGGTPNGATLGAAGADQFVTDFPNEPLSGTFFVSALANQYAGFDLIPGAGDITAQFNAGVDTTCSQCPLGEVRWYYGLDGNPPPGSIDFFGTALHELCHGLGFIDLIDPATGQFPSGVPDIFSRNLVLVDGGTQPLASLSNFQRRQALTSNALFWNGPAVTEQENGLVPVFAPNPFQNGSSIAHWDVSLTPNELMEPFATDVFVRPFLEIPAFEDMLWPLDQQVPNPGQGGPPFTFESTDLNQDLIIDAIDVQIAINAALGLPNSGVANPDINNNGSVDAADVQAVINAALGFNTKNFNIENPASGVDN